MKLLIWDDFPLSNSGGPSGYVYNIHEYLNKNPNSNISFLSDLKNSYTCSTPINNEQISKDNLLRKTYSTLNKSKNIFIKKSLEIYHTIKKTITKKIRHIKDNIDKIHYFTKQQFENPHCPLIDTDVLDKYDYIHFHLLTQFTSFIKAYPDHKSKTILTSHCPCSLTDERLNSEKKWMRLFRRFALKNECKAYNLCDYIMLPCEEALEPYYKVGMIRSVLEKRKKNIFFVPSAILDYQTNTNPKQLKEQLGITNEKFVITFFGRHNKVKGYDILKDVVINLLNKRQDVVIVCAGVGEIPVPKHERWIELGFINNVKDYYSISDLHIIPNRDTFFDLAVLESFRAGKQTLLSWTGGNKYFFNNKENINSGIHYFNINDYKELSSLIEKKIEEKAIDEEQYIQEGESNRQLFLNNYTMPIFIRTYLEKIELLK